MFVHQRGYYHADGQTYKDEDKLILVDHRGKKLFTSTEVDAVAVGLRTACYVLNHTKLARSVGLQLHRPTYPGGIDAPLNVSA